MKNHGIADRLTDLRERGRERRMDSRMKKLNHDNDRLKAELSLLRSGAEEEHTALKEALKGLQPRTVTVKGGRRPGLVRTVVIAGGAYVLGTRDGRQRYDRLIQKARSLFHGMRARQQEGTGDGKLARSGGVGLTANMSDSA